MPSTHPITKAVIPVGGLGTRFLPATRTVPKPLLPVLNVPVIEFAVREAAEAGITDVAIVISPGMESVIDYFNNQTVLESELHSHGRTKLLQSQREITSLANIVTVYQNDPKGPGHAIFQARDFCAGDSFLVIFPDDLIFNNISATEQLLEVYREHGGSVIAVVKTAKEIIHTKGVVGGSHTGDGVISIDQLIEKPAPETAPSDLAIVARYILNNDVFNHLEEERSGAGGEIQITDAIAAMIGNSPVHARQIVGFHADTGNPGGMLLAAIYLAKRDPELAGIVQRVLSE